MSLKDRELPDREIHGLLIDQLLYPVEGHLPLLIVELSGLLPEQPVDVGIPTVGVRAAGHHEGLNPGGRVPEDAAQAVDDVLQLLLLVRLEEPGPLQRAESRPDSDGLQIVDYRLAVAGRAGIAPEIPCVKAARVTRFREQPLGRGWIVGKRRRLPVEVEAARDAAPGDLRKPEGLRLIDRLAVGRLVGREAYASGVPRGLPIPLVGVANPMAGLQGGRSGADARPSLPPTAHVAP